MTPQMGASLLAIALALLNLTLLAVLARRLRHQHAVLERLAGLAPKGRASSRMRPAPTRDPVHILEADRT
jgi:hypothetical protein